MASPSQLSLDSKPHTHSMLLKSFEDQIIASSTTNNATDQDDDHKQKLQDFLSRLEEERFKIDAFKRELPLCMQLLTNAMESSRQQLEAYKGREPVVVLEEFIPMKNSIPSSSSDQILLVENNNNNKMMRCNNAADNKANWMTTAQLWSQETKPTQQGQLPNSSSLIPRKHELETKHSNNCSGGGFLPFSKERNYSNCTTLGLAASSVDNFYNQEEEKKCSDHQPLINVNGAADISINNGSGSAVVAGGNNTSTSTSQRKARRCWSPDLHRRFVNALQMLGGSQVATPKQIRELMKVDGLTNDEVKSHLQKYRLHTRRPSPSPQVSGGPPHQLVVLGGIWVPPEYASTHGGAHAFYGAAATAAAPHPSQSHFCAAAPSSVTQDYYTAQALPPPNSTLSPHHHLHHHAAAALNRHHHQQIQLYKASPSSHPHSSGQDSEDRAAGGERSESIEDGKSESGSWKAGESGDNAAAGGERKDREEEEEEECNRREITLKF
ncbi:Myb family transcription factor EFM [Linum perenne]